GEGSGTPSEPHHTPFPEVETSHPTTSSIPHPSIPTASIPPVTQLVTTPIILYSRRERIAQSSALPTVADKPASPVRDGRSINEGEAAAERNSNDSEEIARSEKIARVLTSIDAATVLVGGIDVPTGSGFIPTIGLHATIVSTVSK
nr:hypothetical protein [Tanacetum cinerariifolium]